MKGLTYVCPLSLSLKGSEYELIYPNIIIAHSIRRTIKQLDELVADMTDSEAEDNDDAGDEATNALADEAAIDEDEPEMESDKALSKSPSEVPIYYDDDNKGSVEAGPSGSTGETPEPDEEPEMESSDDSSLSKLALESSKARQSNRLHGSGRNKQPVKVDKKGKGKARA